MKYKKYLAILMTVMAVSSTTVGVVHAESQKSANTLEKPEGEPPEKPDGEIPDGEGGPGGEKPDGEGGPGGEIPDGQGGPGMGGADTQTYDYAGEMSGVLTADGEEVTSDGETIAATEMDQNAALAENGGTLTISNGTLTKSGDDSDGDRCNFYGVNSIALAVGEDSTMTISDSSLEADSEGSNAIFATDNATIYAANNTIHTTADNSRGLDATYGGTIIADNMTIETEGDHCATVATDRGGGSISVSDSDLSTEGSGSPILYSTGTIEADHVTGTASGSQIAGMEGLNTILIRDSDLTSMITEQTASDPVANGVIIYQSTSGDAETSTGDAARFQAVNSTLTSAIASGSMFYITNTNAEVVLENTVLNFDSSAANLLQIEGNNSNSWGSAGANGANVIFTARQETLSGDISVDTISSLDLYLLDSTSYTGTVFIKENTDGVSSTEAPVTINVGSDSTWIVTGDSTISNLNVQDGGRIVDANGDTVTIVVNGDTVVEGTGSCTVTVTGSYSSDFEIDASNALAENTIA